jgi:alkylated DNA repair protein alkB family protein 7
MTVVVVEGMTLLGRITRNRIHQIARCRCLTTSTLLEPDPSCVDARTAPSDFSPDAAVVYSNVLTPSEGELIAEGISSRMKRRRYEKGHWDAVIINYKEVELSELIFDTPEIANIFHRVRQQLEKHHLDYDPIEWLPCHAIDLKKDGELNAHVDSIKFSGDLVAGISLLSPSIMRLVPDDGAEEQKQDKEADGRVDLYLPPLSLYVLTGVGRYRYSHQLLPDNSTFAKPDGTKIVVPRSHRLSVIFRDAKPST